MADQNWLDNYLAGLRAAMAVTDAGRIRQETAARLPEGVSPTAIPSLTPAVGDAQAAMALMDPQNPGLFLDQYLVDYLFQTPIRDSAAYGYQAAVQAPGNLPQAIGAGFGAAGQYLQENIPDYLRVLDDEGRRIDPEDRPTQPGFGEIFAESRIPLPEGVSREEFLQDIQDLGAGMSNRGDSATSGGRAGISPEAFAQKYGVNPELHPASMMEEAGMMYGINDEFSGGVADLGFEVLDVFDGLVAAFGFADNAMAVGRAFADDDYLAIAAPGIWYRKPTATRAGTPQAALDVYNDAVRMYETTGPSGDMGQLAQSIENFFGNIPGGNASIRWNGPSGTPVDSVPGRGSIHVGDAEVTFDFEDMHGNPVLYINTLYSRSPGGTSPHTLAAMTPLLEFADLHGVPMSTHAGAFGHQTMSTPQLEDIYNKFGFVRLDPSDTSTGSDLVRPPMTMHDTAARSAELAGRRDPIIKARAKYTTRPPKTADEFEEAISANAEGWRSWTPTPQNMAALSGQVDAEQAVQDIFSLAGLRDASWTSVHANATPERFERAMNEFGAGLVEYARAHVTDPGTMRAIEEAVNSRVASSLARGGIDVSGLRLGGLDAPPARITLAGSNESLTDLLARARTTLDDVQGTRLSGEPPPARAGAAGYDSAILDPPEPFDLFEAAGIVEHIPGDIPAAISEVLWNDMPGSLRLVHAGRIDMDEFAADMRIFGRNLDNELGIATGQALARDNPEGYAIYRRMAEFLQDDSRVRMAYGDAQQTASGALTPPAAATITPEAAFAARLPRPEPLTVDEYVTATGIPNAPPDGTHPIAIAAELDNLGESLRLMNDGDINMGDFQVGAQEVGQGIRIWLDSDEGLSLRYGDSAAWDNYSELADFLQSQFQSSSAYRIARSTARTPAPTPGITPGGTQP